MKPLRTGLHPWLDALVRLSSAAEVSIAYILGRARWAGCEFALAYGMRFGSREHCVISTGAAPDEQPLRH
jgi:hypothetical protein